MPFLTTLVVAVAGAARGIARLGGVKLFMHRHGLGLTRLPKNVCSRVLQLPHEQQDVGFVKAFKWWNHFSDRELTGFVEIWNCMVDELRNRDLLTDLEHGKLGFESVQAVREGRVPKLLDPLNVLAMGSTLPANREARRRILTLARSAQMQDLPSGAVRDMPTLSVLIPHYSETILYNGEDLFTERGNTELLHFLVKYYRDEFTNFAERLSREQGLPRERSGVSGGSEGSGQQQQRVWDMDKPLYEWASLRMQTLWRTVEGVCNAYGRALNALAKQQEPGQAGDDREAMVRDKFQVVLAVQQYHKFADPASPKFDVRQLAAVEAMLHSFGDWLTIAYIEEEQCTGGSRYYSCMIDRDCPVLAGAVTAHRSWQRGETHVGMRRPKFRIELPGFPILGHGKSDNQNCAVIFTRGEVLQMIDANQEAYFEASLFLPLAMQEMAGASAKLKGGRRPGILGFREHIFSDIGLIGRQAADSEFAFGTIVQRTMDKPLDARLHYGHPDLLDKLQMVQQGGVSKGTKGLNLSEDIFAGLDLVLRGGWVDYKEYFHVGKGRDMGFMSALSFYAKVSMGNGEQAITRQWMRVGLELPLTRLLGVFYTHVGFYMNQALMSWATMAFSFMAAFFTLCNPLSFAFADAAAGITSSYFGIFYLLFVLASVLPLLLEICIEEGLRAAGRSMVNSLLSLSPVFAAFQSKLMGHFFMSTVHYGGAQYIPTGRGLATSREPFVKLFSTFAGSHMQPAAEIALFLVFSFGVNYGWAFYICILFTVGSWIYAPFLFNPRQFDGRKKAVRDFWKWATWMCSGSGGEAESWVAWSDQAQEVRSHSSMLWGLLPPASLLAAACTSILVLELAPLPPFEVSLTWAQALLTVLPPFFHLVPCLLLAPFHCCCKGGGPSHVLLAAICVSLGCVEMSFVPWYETSAMAVLFHKYISLRFMLEAADGIAAHRFGGCALSLVHKTCRLWTLSWRFPRDALLGVLLSTVNILLASVPCLGRLHGVFLFRTRSQDEEKLNGKKDQEDGKTPQDDEANFGEGGAAASMHRLLKEFAPKVLKTEV